MSNIEKHIADNLVSGLLAVSIIIIAPIALVGVILLIPVYCIGLIANKFMN